MSEVQYTVRDAINRLKAANALGKTNLSDKGVDLPGEENTTTEVVDGIHEINIGDSIVVQYSAETIAPTYGESNIATTDTPPSASYAYTITSE